MISLIPSFSRWRRAGRASLLALGAAVLIWPSLAAAQFSDSYNFLKAVREKDGAKVTELLGKPGSTLVNSRDYSSGETALHIVIGQRDVAWMQFLLAKGANPDTADGGGMTPLLLTVQLHFTEGAEALLKNGASVDKTGSGGETPLIRAVHLRDLPLIRLLIANGANPDKRDTLAGMSARDYAQRDARDTAIADLLDSAKTQKSKSARPVQGPVF